MKHIRVQSVLALLTASLLTTSYVAAQELEPRSFSPGPSGLNIGVVTASYAEGDLVFDSSLPIVGATGNILLGAVGYQRFFGLAGKTAKFSAAAGWADASAEGFVADVYRERKFIGPTDPRFALSVLFAGAPAMTPAQYAKYRPRNVAGFTVGVSPPFGEYETDRLLNVGTNRWTVRTQLGAAAFRGKWMLDGALGGAFFTDNDEYLVNGTLTQDPILSLQGHCSYTFRPQLWVAASATYYRGGESDVDGVPQPSFQSNSRYGLSASFPVAKTQGVSVAYSRGLFTRTGTDYDTLTVAWVVRWLDHRKPRQ